MSIAGVHYPTCYNSSRKVLSIPSLLRIFEMMNGIEQQVCSANFQWSFLENSMGNRCSNVKQLLYYLFELKFTTGYYLYT